MKEKIELLESPRKEIVEFLKERGWKIVLVGTHGIKRRGRNNKYKYEFVMEFIGKKEDPYDELFVDDNEE